MYTLEAISFTTEKMFANFFNVFFPILLVLPLVADHIHEMWSATILFIAEVFRMK